MTLVHAPARKGIRKSLAELNNVFKNGPLSVLLCAMMMLGACTPSPARQPVTTGSMQPTRELSPAENSGRADTPEKAYQAYFDAMRDNDFDQAVQWISSYSLQAEGWTRTDLRDNLKGAWFGALRFQNLEILDVRHISADTAIIHDRITFQQGRLPTPTVKEQWNSARLENGGWLVNAGDLLDTASISLPAKTVNGVTVRLLAIRRYTTKTRVDLQIENANRQVAWWGRGNMSRLILQSRDQTVEAPGPALRFEAQQPYPQVHIEIDQFLSNYPTYVELRNWSQASEDSSDAPNPQAKVWSYSFTVQNLTGE